MKIGNACECFYRLPCYEIMRSGRVLFITWSLMWILLYYVVKIVDFFSNIWNQVSDNLLKLKGEQNLILYRKFDECVRLVWMESVEMECFSFVIYSNDLNFFRLPITSRCMHIFWNQCCRSVRCCNLQDLANVGI